jgi:hypothetical protein
MAYGETKGPSEGDVGKGLKKKTGDERGAGGLYRRRKRRRARARALPDLADAKPGGDNTTLQIIFDVVETFTIYKYKYRRYFHRKAASKQS